MSLDMIKKLTEARAATWEKAKAHLDTVEKEGREFSGEADETWTKLNGDMTGYDTRIAELDAVEVANASAEEMRTKYASAPAAPPADEPKPTDADTLRKMARGEIRDASGKMAFEFMPPTAAEKRDLLKGTTTAGGFTVPTSFYAQLQEHMILNSAIRQTNVTVLNTASGESIQIPKTTTHPTAALIAEAATVTESDAVFGQITLDAFKYGFSTQISSELEQDTGVDLMGYLARRGGEALGNASGAHFVTGDGTNKPKGVVVASTLGITGGAGVAGAFTADNLIDLMFSVIAPYRARGYWMMADASLGAVRKLKDGAGRYLFEPETGIADAPNMGTVLGRPVVSDPNMAAIALGAKSVIFGDMSTYYIRDVAGVRVERSVDFAFQNDLVTWRFLLRTDGDLIDLSGSVKHFIGNAA